MFHDDYINYIASEFDLPYSGLREKYEILNKSQKPKVSQRQPTPQQAKEESQSKNTEKSQSNTGVRDTPSVLELNILSLLLHNRQTLEAAKILPNHLEPWLFPEGAIRNVYNALVNSKSLNQAIDQLSFSGAALVLGSEEKGIREKTLLNCDHQINLVRNDKINSLNVAVAAGIALSELKKING